MGTRGLTAPESACGAVTLVLVPEGGRIEITFTNLDGDVPLSLVVLPTSRQDNLPLQVGRGQTAFR
jgi:hypothetical protein